MNHSSAFSRWRTPILSLVALLSVGGAGSLPAQADFLEAAPQVSFRGVVQGIAPDAVAIGTMSGTVLVPTNESSFQVNGMPFSPESLVAGTEVDVTVPQSLEPALRFSGLVVGNDPVFATPLGQPTFDGFLADSALPPGLVPVNLYAPSQAVAEVPAGFAALPAGVAPPAPVLASLPLIPLAPVTDRHYADMTHAVASLQSGQGAAGLPPAAAFTPLENGANAFQNPRGVLTSPTDGQAPDGPRFPPAVPQGDPSVRTYGNADAAAFPQGGYYAPSSTPYGQGTPYPNTQAYSSNNPYANPYGNPQPYGNNGFQYGSSTYPPQYGYNPNTPQFSPYGTLPYPMQPPNGYAPPSYPPVGYAPAPYPQGGYAPTPYAPTASPYGYAPQAAGPYGTLGNGLTLGYNSQPYSPYGMSPYGTSPNGMSPYGMSSYGTPGLGTGLSLSFDGISLSLPFGGNNYSPYASAGPFGLGMPFGYGQSYATLSFLGINLSLPFGNNNYNPYSFSPVAYSPFGYPGVLGYGAAPYVVQEVLYRPVYMGRFNSYGSLGVLSGIQGNNVLVRGPNGPMTFPTGALPEAWMHHGVAVQMASGQVQTMPLHDAIRLQQAGQATLLSHPNVPLTTLASTVPIITSAGNVHTVPLQTALNLQQSGRAAFGLASSPPLRHFGGQNRVGSTANVRALQHMGFSVPNRGEILGGTAAASNTNPANLHPQTTWNHTGTVSGGAPSPSSLKGSWSGRSSGQGHWIPGAGNGGPVSASGNAGVASYSPTGSPHAWTRGGVSSGAPSKAGYSRGPAGPPNFTSAGSQTYTHALNPGITNPSLPPAETWTRGQAPGNASPQRYNGLPPAEHYNNLPTNTAVNTSAFPGQGVPQQGQFHQYQGQGESYHATSSGYTSPAVVEHSGPQQNWSSPQGAHYNSAAQSYTPSQNQGGQPRYNAGGPQQTYPYNGGGQQYTPPQQNQAGQSRYNGGSPQQSFRPQFNGASQQYTPPQQNQAGSPRFNGGTPQQTYQPPSGGQFSIPPQQTQNGSARFSGGTPQTYQPPPGGQYQSGSSRYNGGAPQQTFQTPQFNSGGQPSAQPQSPSGPRFNGASQQYEPSESQGAQRYRGPQQYSEGSHNGSAAPLGTHVPSLGSHGSNPGGGHGAPSHSSAPGGAGSRGSGGHGGNGHSHDTKDSGNTGGR